MAVNRESLPEGLTADIKEYLQITWSDPATDGRVTNMTASGMSYLNDKLGTEADYSADGLPRTLLFEYVRYMRDAALDVFENNYLSMIIAARNKNLVAEATEGEA